MPNPRAATNRPSSMMLTAHPGRSVPSHSRNNSRSAASLLAFTDSLRPFPRYFSSLLVSLCPLRLCGENPPLVLTPVRRDVPPECIAEHDRIFEQVWRLRVLGR